jgi:NADH:ubiquinone oxidoreductase subunit 5 (subunit L)/multisubunit Na+/H+ antiporter MnhA subunit
LGLSSFLLIAFYRTRYLPVKNAVKVFSIYRIGDLGILLAMWLAHHTWHTNLTFNQLSLADGSDVPSLAHPWTHLIIIGCIVVAAAAKSAQLPFTSWLPRAMEGPTPSSAVFYGALSVHMGIFLLIRTYPMWHHENAARVAIAMLGGFTSILAYMTARAQPSIKAKIAYRSASHIGLMFIEVALGWHWLALLHFTANALVRAYQLLISPSVVSYLIKKQGYAPLDQSEPFQSVSASKWRSTLYAQGLFEWNLDQTISNLLWRPIKVVGQWFHWLHIRSVLIWFTVLYLTSWVLWAFRAHLFSEVMTALTYLLALASLALVIKSLHERRRARISWLILILSHGLLAQAALLRPDFGVQQGLIYLSGVVIAGGMGYAILWRLYKRERSIKLSKFNGHVYEYPRLSFGFLLATLGISGFPITPTFLGEDLILAGVLPHQVLLITVFALNFLLMSLAAMRIYAKVFLGPHLKNYHSTAHRSG